MTLELISVVADSAAAFGVVGSLIFVGFQVRQNSAGLHNAAAQSLVATYQDLFENVIDSGEFAGILRQGFRDLDSLDEASETRFYAFSSKALRVYQGLHWQWQKGAIDDGLFKSMTTLFEDFATSPGWRDVWRNRRHQYDADFQKFIDTMMSEDKGRPLYSDPIARED